MVTATDETSFPLEVSRADAAAAVTRRYAYWSAGAGIIPLPLIDLVLIGGVQVKMVYELAKVYDIPFSETRAKALISALVGTVVPFGAASVVVGGVTSFIKAIPVIGGIATLTIGPALGFASTWAVGRVFAKHFAEGGNLSNFVPDKARAFYDKEFAAARKAAPTDAAVKDAVVAEAPVAEDAEPKK